MTFCNYELPDPKRPYNSDEEDEDQEDFNGTDAYREAFEADQRIKRHF